jgi:hypothetical protein
MTLIDQLPKKPFRKTPGVWVRRLVIFSKLQPSPEIIRDISLRRGLNIVWAEEPESGDDKGDIAGHSAGKTTLCRLIRYVLGEKTYSNHGGMKNIRAAFPNGYVAAEIMIDSQQWAVLRPLGENRNSWILRGGTIETIVTEKGEPAYQDSYPAQIGLSRRVEGLRSATVVRTQEEIKWAHVLAWCARDQEARFQNIYEWRSPRSDSEWPAFRFPKADPLFVMRVVLGLYMRDELGTEETMAKNLRQLELAEQQYESLKREPQFWHQHYGDRLRDILKVRFPADSEAIQKAPMMSSELMPDLKRFVDRAIFVMEEQASDLLKHADKIQQELNSNAESTGAARLDLRELEGLFSLDQKAASEIQAGLGEAANARKVSDDHRMCPYADILVGKCSHVVDRRRQLRPGELQAAHNLEQMEAERLTAQEKLSRQIQALQEKLKQSDSDQNRLIEQQRRFYEQVHSLADARKQLESDFAQLTAWQGRIEAPEKTEKMREAGQRITDLKSKVVEEQGRLNQLLANHDANRDLLNRIFSCAARLVLPTSAYDGRVSFENRELNFQITHGGAMSGEAIETLAVLLSDISCLIFNLLSPESHLPGFLLHDSPREADLGLRLYHSFINFVAQLEEELSDADGCPFQYILTTTTPPPRELRTKRFIVLQLDASNEQDLLFRRDLSRPPESEELPLLTAE